MKRQAKVVFHFSDEENNAKKQKSNTLPTLHVDDNIHQIMLFLTPKFIITTCMIISKQWNEQAKKIPISLSMKQVPNCSSSIDFNLTSIDWVNDETCYEGLKWISNCPQMINLTELTLGSYSSFGNRKNLVGDDGCQLLNSPYLKNLTSLDLTSQNIGNKGCRFIANALNLSKLTTLTLSSNPFDKEGIKELANSPNMSNITSLALMDSNSGNEGCQAIITSPYLSKLKKLHLYSAQFTELVFSKPLVNLEELYLDFNKVNKISAGSNICNLNVLDL